MLLRFQNSILEMIAKGEPLEVTLDRLCIEAERLLSGGCCAIVSVDPSGRLECVSAPGFPEPYRHALNAIVVGPDVGSCGTAIYLNRQACVTDIEVDHKWASFRSLALPLGLRACTSSPVRDQNGKAVGAFAICFRDKRPPTDDEQEVLAACINLCELAMRRHRRVIDRERRATIDSLTDLPNRSAFDEALACLRCEFPGSWGLFVLDIDNLKVTNDTFGHEAGDVLIRAVASRISASLSPDVTFRTGGDEFTTILQDREGLHDLYHTAQVVLSALSAPVPIGGHTVIPRITIGGAVLAPQDSNPELVRRNADFALYHAKETQRGGFVRYWPGIGTRMALRRDSIRDVAEALREGRIDAQYQPVLRLDSGLIVGFEALSRMTNAAGKVLPASMFQEAFADARVASELTDRMLTRITSDIRRWLDQGLSVKHIGLNVSSADFYAGDLAVKLQRSFDANNLSLAHLVLEVTENVYVGQRDRVVSDGIAELRAKGVRVALDDFGTGFAALTHLLTMPVDVLKIDQSFVRRLAPTDPSAAIVRGVLQIARDLGIDVVAEGVETHDQATTLRAMGCLMGQGYAFAKAVPRERAADMLRHHGEGMIGATPLPVIKGRNSELSASVA